MGRARPESSRDEQQGPILACPTETHKNRGACSSRRCVGVTLDLFELFVFQSTLSAVTACDSPGISPDTVIKFIRASTNPPIGIPVGTPSLNLVHALASNHPTSSFRFRLYDMMKGLMPR